jgi:hypothetical protein
MSYDPNQPQPPYGQPPYPQSQPPYGQPQQPYGQPQPPYEQPPQPYAQTQYSVPPPPPGYAAPPPKKSRRRLWITLGIIFGVILLIFVGGIVAIIAYVNNSPAKTVTQQYYDAVKTQNYAQAYSYLDIQTLTLNGQQQQATQALYTQVAQLIDQQNGKVTDYNITGVSLNSSTSAGSTATVTVNVTRNGKTQEVHVQLRQEGNDWKIVSIDHL